MSARLAKADLRARGAADTAVGVDDSARDGIDVFFMTKGDAAKFTAAVLALAPARVRKESSKLVSKDSKSNVSRSQHTALVELCPLCKGDLVVVAAGDAAGGKARDRGFVVVFSSPPQTPAKRLASRDAPRTGRFVTRRAALHLLSV